MSCGPAARLFRLTAAIGEFKVRFKEAVEAVSRGEGMVISYSRKRENAAIIVPYDTYRHRNALEHQSVRVVARVIRTPVPCQVRPLCPQLDVVAHPVFAVRVAREHLDAAHVAAVAGAGPRTPGRGARSAADSRTRTRATTPAPWETEARIRSLTRTGSCGGRRSARDSSRSR